MLAGKLSGDLTALSFHKLSDCTHCVLHCTAGIQCSNNLFRSAQPMLGNFLVCVILALNANEH